MAIAYTVPAQHFDPLKIPNHYNQIQQANYLFRLIRSPYSQKR